eukprot:scaffold130879_cov34-Prasinocladus_malaysianus.AAC.1
MEVALAGNLFDAGSAAAVQNLAFCNSTECDIPGSNDTEADGSALFALDAAQLHATFLKAQARVARPESGWRFDDLDRVVSRFKSKPYKAALIFCDNAGADTMGATLLARQLASLSGSQTRVALAANSTPALNDITHAELAGFVQAASERDPVLAGLVRDGRLVCLPSGQPSTLLDLGTCGPELNEWVRRQPAEPEEWLVVLDGMGRSLESNWRAADFMRPGVDVLSLAMVKSEINATRLGAEVYDCVVRLNTAGS